MINATTIKEVFELAIRQHQEGKLVEAESLYRQILAVESEHAESIHHLGVIAHQVGRNEEAIRWIRQAIALAPGCVEAYNNLGVVLKDQGRLDEAIVAYRQAMALRPGMHEVQRNLEAAMSECSQGAGGNFASAPIPTVNAAKPAVAPSSLSAHDAAPPQLEGLSAEELPEVWPAWVEHQVMQMRSRVWQGEEDSLANLLLLGTSFTREPRITNSYRATLLEQLGGEEAADRMINGVAVARSRDLARALASTSDDERLLTMREVVVRAGHAPGIQAEQARLAQYLYDNLVRFLNDARAFSAELARAKSTTPEAESNKLPNLYQTRGLSTDSSILVDFALEQGLSKAISAGFLKLASVRRAAIVGAGLDLIDKMGGHDIHPPQITQPLVLIDSLLKLGLADEQNLQMTTFDISTRVNRHIERAISRAASAQSYSLNLVHDDSWGWCPEAVRFWATCGDRIGASETRLPSPGLNGVSTRAIQVDSEWVTRLRPIELNFIYQQLPAPEDRSFDLLISTNVFCYYNPFEQGLALRNAELSLRPGGILLTTESLPCHGSSDILLVDSTRVQTSKADGYVIFCYQKRC